MSKLGDAMGGGGTSNSGLKALVTRLKNEVTAKKEKLERKDEKSRDMKEKMEDTFTSMVNFGETHSVNYLASLSEGYWGHDKVAPKGIHIPGVTGLLFELGGLYGTYKGAGWASHVTSVGRGLVGAFVGSAGMRHGGAIKADAQKKKANGAAAEKVEVPAGAKAGDTFEVTGADGQKRKALVVKQDDGSLGVTFQGSSNWRKVEATPTRALLSPGRRQDDDDDDEERPRRRPNRRFPAGRR